MFPSSLLAIAALVLLASTASCTDRATTLNELRVETEEYEAREWLQRAKRKFSLYSTNSGIMYRFIHKHYGTWQKSPTERTSCDIHHKYTNKNGKVYEDTFSDGSALKHARPDLLLPGVKEMMMKMKPGDRVEMFLHPRLAYGLEGHLPHVKRNEPISVELEIVSCANSKKPERPKREMPKWDPDLPEWDLDLPEMPDLPSMKESWNALNEQMEADGNAFGISFDEIEAIAERVKKNMGMLREKLHNNELNPALQTEL